MASRQMENGNRAEKALCTEIFRSRGFFAYNCPKDSHGKQPVDVIAFRGFPRGYIIYMVDSKNIEKGSSFPLSRVEQDQHFSLSYAVRSCGLDPECGGFVLYFGKDRPRYLSYTEYMRMYEEGINRAHEAELPYFEDVFQRKIESFAK